MYEMFSFKTVIRWDDAGWGTLVRFYFLSQTILNLSVFDWVQETAITAQTILNFCTTTSKKEQIHKLLKLLLSLTISAPSLFQFKGTVTLEKNGEMIEVEVYIRTSKDSKCKKATIIL